MSQFAIPEHASGDSLWRYYRHSLVLLDDARQLVRSGGGTSIPKFLRFLSHAEALKLLEQQREELDRQVFMALAASYEADVRLWLYAEEGTRKRQDPLKRALKALTSKHNKGVFRLWLVDLIDMTKLLLASTHVRPSVATEFKRYVKRRHWLAHGRYWDDREMARCDPIELRSVGRKFLAALKSL